MKNGGKKLYTPAYLDLIQVRTDNLRDTAKRTLQMPGIEEGERDNLDLALKRLGSIDALVKIIRKRPDALVHLWKAMGAVYIIGTRGTENPLTQKIRKDKAAQSTAKARNAIPRIRDGDRINKVIDRHCTAYKNRKRAGNKRGTAEDILPGVNAELVESEINPLSLDALRKRIARL